MLAMGRKRPKQKTPEANSRMATQPTSDRKQSVENSPKVHDISPSSDASVQCHSRYLRRDSSTISTCSRTASTSRHSTRRREKSPQSTQEAQMADARFQASQLYNLELDVMHLQQEIQRLAEYQHILDARTFNRRDALDGYYVKTVQEYHRVFENGYRPGSPLDATQYVMQTMDENLSIGGFGGRGVMLHQWEQYTKALSGLEFHYLRSQVLSMEGHTVVTSYASYKHIVTQDTVEVMFPEALRQYPRIVTKMLGRVFKGVGKFDFVFDTQTHNIISFDFELDFLEEFSRLLQDPRDLCAIFKGARITEECLIGDVTGYGEVTSSPNAGTIATAKVEKKTEASFDTDLEDKTPSGHSDEEWRQPSLTNRTGRRKEIWE